MLRQGRIVVQVPDWASEGFSNELVLRWALPPRWLQLPIRAIRRTGDLSFRFQPMFQIMAVFTAASLEQHIGPLLDSGHQVRVP